MIENEKKKQCEHCDEPICDKNVTGLCGACQEVEDIEDMFEEAGYPPADDSHRY